MPHTGKPRLLLFAMSRRHRMRLLHGAFMVGGLTYMLCLATLTMKWIDVRIPLTFPGLLGVAVGLLLVFRTNTAYDRWWEGRRLLGDMVNASRFLALKLDTWLPANDHRRHGFAATLAEYARTLAEHLASPPSKPRPMISRPLEVLDRLSRDLDSLRRDGVVSEERTIILEESVRMLTNVLGSCERIKTTPMPIAYATHLEIIVLLYTLLVPFGLMQDLGWFTVPLVMLVFYMLEGIMYIGEEIEDPFGDDPNDLAGYDIALNVARNVQTLLTGAAGEPPRTLPAQRLEAV